jgi:hypothetical protein
VDAANAELRERLAYLVGGRLSPSRVPIQSEGIETASEPLDAIITHIEVNDKHGVGALTRKIFGDGSHVLSVRSQDHFDGDQQFGSRQVRLSHRGGRALVYADVLAAMPNERPRRIVCIPYYPDDVRTAIALKDIHAVPMCTYLMDDQNVCSDGIPDDLMRELLAKSELRLAISAELRAAYQEKFGLRFWVLPPVVAPELIQSEPRMPPPTALQARRGVVVGNIWGQRWLQLLRATVRGTGVKLDWYCNSGFRWKNFDVDELAADGIHAHGAALDEALVAILRERPFVVLPSGTLDDTDDRKFIAELSLPSRIPYVFATSNTPIIVLGHERTAAARFVTRSGLGLVAPYDSASFLRAVESVSEPENQIGMRRRAAQMAPSFSAHGVSDWIWESLEAGAAMDDRFEKLLPEPP